MVRTILGRVWKERRLIRLCLRGVGWRSAEMRAMWPVHTWLPDAHVEAPTGGSVILAAIMLKMGGYGFLRFSLPIAPDASRELDGLIISLSLIAVVYIGFVALVQRDMK